MFIADPLGSQRAFLVYRHYLSAFINAARYTCISTRYYNEHTPRAESPTRLWPIGREGKINTFLAESVVAGASTEALQALQRAVLASSTDFTAHGKPVHFLRSFVVPGDGLVLWFFEAMDPIDIRDIYEANELPFTRIVEVTEMLATPE